MNALLDSAHTWFFESSSHELGGALVVRLVEGIKAPERQHVDVGETTLGPYFPVRVEPHSRCVEVRFENAVTFLVVNESYDTKDPEMIRGVGRFLFVATSSSFRKFTVERTLLTQLCEEPYEEYLLWCEDRLFRILATATPKITLLEEPPNLSLERTETWSAN